MLHLPIPHIRCLTFLFYTNSLADVLPKHDPQLVKVIKGVSSTNTLKARAAINELAAIIEAPEKQAVLRDYEEIFIQNVLAQFKV